MKTTNERIKALRAKKAEMAAELAVAISEAAEPGFLWARAEALGIVRRVRALIAERAKVDADAEMGQEIAEIAKYHLGIETLEERGRDRLDFHEVGVLGLRRALEAAYEAGAKAAR